MTDLASAAAEVADAEVKMVAKTKTARHSSFREGDFGIDARNVQWEMPTRKLVDVEIRLRWCARHQHEFDERSIW